MARNVSFDEALRVLERTPTVIRKEVGVVVRQAALLVEGQVKVFTGWQEGEDGALPAQGPGGAYLPCPYDPPPRQTGRLARGTSSAVIETPTGFQALVGNSVSDYNRFVHDGTSIMEARPFMADAVTVQRTNVLKLISLGIKKGLQKAGAGASA